MRRAAVTSRRSPGADAVEALAADPETDAVLQAIVGAAGVAPTFAAARTGKRLMLANKESVVCGGALLMKTVAECGAELFPVDSEHSAVFQCLAAADPNARSRARIILTASGGPVSRAKDARRHHACYGGQTSEMEHGPQDQC